MPVLSTGHIYSSVSAVCRLTELTEQLTKIGMSSEISESTMFNSPIAINGKSTEVKLPDTLIENIYTLYHYDLKTASWIKITDYKQVINKLILTKSYSGILIAFPLDAFRDTFYEDGTYDYEMFLTRVDGRVYRNITISSSSYLPSPYINLSFSFNSNGPWYTSISSPFLFSTFYMRVGIINMSTLAKTQVVPSEMINLTCLACE
jgi:hypothetical protein